MKRQLLAMLAGVALALGGSVGTAVALPGPNGHNNKGLCTAYFNGSERGQAEKRKAPPFQALERAADDQDPNTTNDVERFCAGLIGGRAGRGGSTPGGGRP